METARELLRRAAYLAYRFKADRCMENAAALTYMSLFALVPLLTVVYTMALSLIHISEPTRHDSGSRMPSSA